MNRKKLLDNLSGDHQFYDSCPNCNEEKEHGWFYCPYCGTKLYFRTR